MDDENNEDRSPPALGLVVAFVVGSAATVAELVYVQLCWLPRAKGPVTKYVLLFLAAGVFLGWLRAVIHVGRLGHYIMIVLCIQYVLLAIALGAWAMLWLRLHGLL